MRKKSDRDVIKCLLEVGRGNKGRPVVPLPPIRKEARTDVQLTVQPLREKLHPKKIAEFFFALRARSWARVHVWQLHVDILPAAYSELQQGWGRKKVKSDWVAAAERCKSAHGPPTAAKNRRPQHRIAQQKRTFCVFDQQDDFVLPRVGSQLVAVGPLPTLGTVWLAELIFSLHP